MPDHQPSHGEFRHMLVQTRKARGLSQLALGNAVDISQKHISFLETGRSSPGRDVVQRLAAGLELSNIETDVFLASAGFAPTFQKHDSAVFTAAITAVHSIMEQQNPYPAILLDTAQDIIATNTGFDRLLAFLDPTDRISKSIEGPPNLLRIIFHAQGLYPHIVEPRRLVSSVLQRVLRESRGDPEATKLIQEVLSWPHIRRLNVPDLSEIDPAVLYEERYRVDGVDIGLICLITSIGAPGSAAAERLRLEMFHPADDETDAMIWQIVAKDS